MYFDWRLREKCVNGELSYNPDSYTSIADYFGCEGKGEDRLNKYEYNPLTKRFTIDQLNTQDDSAEVEKFCNSLNFKKIVPQLIVKPVVNPLDKKRKGVTAKDKERLEEWIKVRDSVRNSSIMATVWDTVWDTSARGTVWEAVRNTVWDSVSERTDRDTVYAYLSSFFQLDEWKNIKRKKGEPPFQPCVDLWESGLIPSFDGKTWRLHGDEGKILYKRTKQRR